MKTVVRQETDSTVCRICLEEANEADNPLVTPCLCKGSMKWIHVSCIIEWLSSKRTQRLGHFIKTYYWKTVECDLCKSALPARVYSEKYKSTFELLVYTDPGSPNYIV